MKSKVCTFACHIPFSSDEMPSKRGVNEEDVGQQFIQQQKHSSDEPPDTCSISHVM